MKFCSDCRQYQRDLFDVLTFTHRYSKCKRTAINHPDLAENYCSMEREEWLHKETCGPEGKYFEAKP